MIEEGHCFYDQLQHSKNILLVKDDVGQPKPCLRKLPSITHAYGYKSRADRDSAKLVMSDWKMHSPSKVNRTLKDYKILNRKLLARNSENPQAYRNQPGVLVTHRKAPSMVNPREIVHGVRNKPSTPINKIIANEYGNNASIEKHHIYYNLRYTPQPENKFTKPFISKRHGKAEDEDKPLFKIKRFAKIKSRFSSEPRRYNS